MATMSGEWPTLDSVTQLPSLPGYITTIMSVSSQVETQSPPWDDTGQSAAGRSSRALTPPSQAVAPVTGVSVRGGRFNNSASANNNFSLSFFNLILGPRDNSAPSGVQSESPSSIYSRLLLPKAYGFPLYDPQPSGLNNEYRSEGVRIGDVGIVTTGGKFDFLFNICHSADHPINRGGVPDGFSPPQWARNIAFSAEDCRDPGDYVINGSIETIESDPTNGGYRFKGTAGEAAVLVIPAPTITAHADNTIDFRDYAAQNTVAWYKFVTEGLRRDIPNGSIYLITGWEKTQSWGTASFQANMHDFELVYRNKAWAQHGSATAKRGPRGANVEDPAPYNQCIFLNGYKAMLGESLWDRVVGTVQVSAVGNIATKASSSGSGSGLSMGTGASLGGSLTRWLYTSGQDQGDSARQPGLAMDQNESDMVALESVDSATSEDVHPSNLINRFLLHKFPEADIAITYDPVWQFLTEDPHLPFQDQIESCYTINNRNGVVYLSTTKSAKRGWVYDTEIGMFTCNLEEDFLENPPSDHGGTYMSAVVWLSKGQRRALGKVFLPIREEEDINAGSLESYWHYAGSDNSSPNASTSEPESQNVKNYIALLHNHFQKPDKKQHTLSYSDKPKGPGNATVWVVNCEVDDKVVASGEGHTIAEAKMAAAKKAYKDIVGPEQSSA